MKNKLQLPFLLICSILLLLYGCGKTKNERAARMGVRFSQVYGTSWFELVDFKGDGDIDFILLSTFPDYVHAPYRSFLFLENKECATFTFKENTLCDSKKGKWFLMDKGELDGDGDIILSSFALPFIQAPKEMEVYWKEQEADLMLLSNKLRWPPLC